MNSYGNKENVNVALGGGCGFSGLLTIAFVVLKLCGVIDWSWWLVLLPLIISVSLPIVIILIMLLGCLIWWLCNNAKSKRAAKKRYRRYKEGKNENQNKN